MRFVAVDCAVLVAPNSLVIVGTLILSLMSHPGHILETFLCETFFHISYWSS